MVCRNLRHAYLQEVGLTQISGDHDFYLFCFFFKFFSELDKFEGRFHNKFQDWHIPPSSSLKLVEFETYYMKPNPPLFFRQQNMRWSRNMVHSHFTLCLRLCDYLKRLFPTPMVRPLDESQGFSPLQGHGSWLVCEVALK